MQILNDRKVRESMATEQKNEGLFERRLAEELWLEYFNRYLFEHSHITEKEYRLMVEKIAQHCARKHKQTSR